MQLRAVVAAVFVASLPALGVAGHEDWPKRNIVDTLVPSLSGNASVYLPGSDGFDEATSRWSQLGAPNITIVVEVATEDDVVSTVRTSVVDPTNSGHSMACRSEKQKLI